MNNWNEVKTTLTSWNQVKTNYFNWMSIYYSWETPKTNWKATDYFNLDDAIRIEYNTQLLNSKINNLGYISTYTTPTFTWSYSTIPNVDCFKRMKQNIQNMVDVFYVFDTTPQIAVNSNTTFTYNDANILERNLMDLMYCYNGLIGDAKYCGTYICGQELNL